MRSSIILIIVLFLGILFSCSQENENEVMTGSIRLLLTDAPLPMDTVENAFVTLEKIEIRTKEDEEFEADENGGGYITLFDESKVFNLAELRNGITEELALVDVPAGNYDLVRMQISDASVELKGGGIYDLLIPSGASSGLKIFINPDITVEGGITEELLLDFDLSRSLIPKGSLDNLRGFNFKPVIKAVNISTSGSIEGNVTDEQAQSLKGVEIWIKKDTIESTTFSGETGYYAMIGIPAGSYDLYAAKEFYDTLFIEDVQIIAGNRTTFDLELMESE